MQANGGIRKTSDLALEAAKRAQEAARRAQEALRRAEEAKAKQQAEKTKAKPADADATQRPGGAKSAMTLLEAKVEQAPEKLVAKVVEDPGTVVAAAAENPVKFTDLALRGAGVAMGGVVGSAAFQTVRNSLSARNKLNEIKRLASAIQEAKAADAPTLTTGLKKAAEEAAKPRELRNLDKLGKLNAGLSVVSGVNSALNLRNSVAALGDGASAREIATVASDALGAVRGADEAMKLFKNANIGFLGGKISPVLSIGASGADSVKRVDTLIKDWDDLSTKDKVANFAALGGNVADIVGSGMVLTGVGAPIGVALKGLGAGLSLVGMGVQHFDAIKGGAAKLVSALNPYD